MARRSENVSVGHTCTDAHPDERTMQKHNASTHTHIHRMGKAHIEKLFSFLKSLQTALSNPPPKKEFWKITGAGFYRTGVRFTKYLMIYDTIILSLSYKIILR